MLQSDGPVLGEHERECGHLLGSSAINLKNSEIKQINHNLDEEALEFLGVAVSN
jgi:hypothetical protein